MIGPPKPRGGRPKGGRPTICGGGP